MSAQARIEWTGNIQAHQPVKPAPAPVHELDSVAGVHTCTGCLWATFTYTDKLHPETTQEAVNRAFAIHLLTTAQEAVNRAFAIHLLTTAQDEP